MKRLLLIADSNNIYTKRMLENVLLPAGYEVVLYPIWGDRGVYADFFREKGVTVYRDSHTLPLVRHVPRLRMWARILLNLRDLARLGPFDAVHNHYLCAKDLALGQGAARRFGCVWACSFWGSDLLRAPLGNLRRMRPYLMRCDGLSVVNPTTSPTCAKPWATPWPANAAPSPLGSPAMTTSPACKKPTTAAPAAKPWASTRTPLWWPCATTPPAPSAPWKCSRPSPPCRPSASRR